MRDRNVEAAREEAAAAIAAAGYRLGAVQDFAPYAEAVSLEIKPSEHTGMMVPCLVVRIPITKGIRQ